MKLLVFAHTPPPHHGQSYMVELMLNGFGGDARGKKSTGANPVAANAFGIECYHVDVRISRKLSDIGEFQFSKTLLILWFCLQAIYLRFRFGVTNFYYVPAPGKRVAVYRDWLIMLLCRPFFKRLILHWHAAGLAKWMETETSIHLRAFTFHRFRPVNLSIVLSNFNLADARKLLSHNIKVVDNGIPDPCPDFATTTKPLRVERFQRRQQTFSPGTAAEPLRVNIVYLAHCSRSKGLFAAMEGVRQANELLRTRALPITLVLNVAGAFVTDEEEREFHQSRQRPDLAPVITYLGFVSGAEKNKLLQEADLMLAPTLYLGENQPVNLIEAMAFGLPIITTRWRSLPEMLPPQYPGLITRQDPAEIAATLLKVLATESGEPMRGHFLARFALQRHLTTLAEALHSVETSPAQPVPSTPTSGFQKTHNQITLS